MADKDLILKEKVAHSGIFDFSAFYSYAHSWFYEEGYGVVEDKYSEKIAGNKKNLYIEWTVTKKLTDYFKIEYKLKYYIDNLTDVEVEIDGEKKSMNKGNVMVEMKGYLVKDYESKWEVSPIHRFLRDVYNKYVIPGRINDLSGKTIGDLQTFKDELKAFLELSGKR